MARPAQPITANEEERRRLGEWATLPKLGARARVVLFSLEGLSLDAIMERTGMSRSTVVKWRDRFRETGLAGLMDAKRKGRPWSITQDQMTQLIELYGKKYRDRTPGWSQERIAGQVGMPAATVQRFLRLIADSFNPMHVPSSFERTLGHPVFTDHQHRMLGVYLGPTAHAFVIGHVRVGPSVADPLNPYRPSQLSFLDPPFGVQLHEWLHSSYGGWRPYKRQLDLAGFLAAVDRQFKRMRVIVHIHGDRTMNDPTLRSWRQQKRRFTFVQTPGFEPWLSHFEAWLHSTPERLPVRSKSRSWSEYVAWLIALVRENEVARLPPFVWLNDYTTKPEDS